MSKSSAAVSAAIPARPSVPGTSTPYTTACVTAESHANGQFTIQAQMFQCSAQPCYYALIVYGRARQY